MPACLFIDAIAHGRFCTHELLVARPRVLGLSPETHQSMLLLVLDIPYRVVLLCKHVVEMFSTQPDRQSQLEAEEERQAFSSRSLP